MDADPSPSRSARTPRFCRGREASQVPPGAGALRGLGGPRGPRRRVMLSCQPLALARWDRIERGVSGEARNFLMAGEQKVVTESVG